MADTVIELVLNELSGVVREEVDLQRGVKQEIDKVRKELEAMKAFLRFVDDQKEKDPNPMLQTWVEQVREVAFEIEDVVDEYLLRVPYGNGDDASRAHNSCLGKICSICTKWKAKHQIGSELRNIIAKVKEISERSKRYDYQQSSSSSPSSARDNSEIDRFRSSTVSVDESELIGINESKKKLMDMLNNGEQNLKVLAIVGMGGLGKTALARQIYGDVSRFKRRAFATVSQTLKEEEFLKDIMWQLSGGEKLDMQQFSINQLREGVRKRLRDECYMIVVDDVWKTQHWDQIKGLFPKNNQGSRVVVTTRKKNVASRGDDIYELKPLSDTTSWDLFCTKVFPSQSCPSNLVHICEDIVFNKCKGVPIAILAISGILRSKDERDVNAWKKVQQSLHIELEENEELEMTKKILSLSIDELPYHLKSCYMYLCVFPEDYGIEWTRVIRLWISEGFVAKKEGRTLEEDADSYLYELANRNLIQTFKNYLGQRGKHFRIHDFLRDIVLSKSKEERFVEVIRKAEVMEIRARRLSIHHVNESVKRLAPLLRIRSLLMFSWGDEVPYGTSSILSNDAFKLLNVLDLENAPLDSFPEEICTLFLLRYLSLRETNISNIPKSIGNLRRLESLDLKYTWVTELPDEISMLQKLRHLRVGQYLASFKVTADIGGLVSLQRLCLLEVPEKSEWMKALRSLTQMRKLGLGNLKEQHWREVCFCISNMTNLRSLMLQTEGLFELEYLGSPPPTLERLHLNGRLNELPSWVSSSSIGNLQELKLHNTRLKKDPGTSLGGLPNLIALYLKEAFDDGIKMRVVLPGSFPSLRRLQVLSMGIWDAIGQFETANKEHTWRRIVEGSNRIGLDKLIDLD